MPETIEAIRAQLHFMSEELRVSSVLSHSNVTAIQKCPDGLPPGLLDLNVAVLLKGLFI